MNTVWLCLLIYWLLSMLFVWFCFRTYLNDDEQTAAKSWWGQLSREGKLVFYVLSGFSAPLTFPFAMYGAVSCVLRDHLHWKKELKTHRDYVCDRIHPANLPAEVEEYFEQRTPEALELGFFEAGNYVIAREPLMMYGRYFLHADLPAYYALLHIADTQSQCLVTLFNDGSVNETSPSNDVLDPEDYPTSCSFHARFVAAEAPAQEYLKQHVDGIIERQERTGAQPILYQTHQLPDVMIHEKRVFNRLKQEQGEITSEVPESVQPMGKIVENVRSLREVVCT